MYYFKFDQIQLQVLYLQYSAFAVKKKGLLLKQGEHWSKKNGLGHIWQLLHISCNFKLQMCDHSLLAKGPRGRCPCLVCLAGLFHGTEKHMGTKHQVPATGTDTWPHRQRQHHLNRKQSVQSKQSSPGFTITKWNSIWLVFRLTSLGYPTGPIINRQDRGVIGPIVFCLFWQHVENFINRNRSSLHTCVLT